MKIKHFIFMHAIVAALFLQSCKILYVPNMQNVPLFREKNEGSANIAFSNYQLAYAVSNHVGIMVNGQYRQSSWSLTLNDADEKFKSKMSLIEAGAGYFRPIGKLAVFEAYGGGGIGKVSFNHDIIDNVNSADSYFGKYSANTLRFFVQPGIGITNDYLDFALSTRLVALKFAKVDTSGFSNSDLIDQDISGLDKQLYTFIEPALTIRAGWQYVKFHFQTVFAFKTNSEAINYNPVSFNLGIHINISPRYYSANKEY